MQSTIIGTPHLKFNDPSKFNVVCDGNSLTAGNGGGGNPYPSLLASMSPLNGKSTVTNTGVSGNTTQQMTAAARPDPYWVAGKTNILVVWEGTNSIAPAGGNVTPQQAATDMQNYISARLALHPWLVVLVNCLPRQESSQSASFTLNNKLNTYNTLLAANYKTWGAKVLVDVRQAGSPFAFTDYTDAAFTTAFNTGLWASSDTPHIHLSGYGYNKIAQMVAAGLKQLPIR
jgi:lysophospholipase L1-like esterase